MRSLKKLLDSAKKSAIYSIKTVSKKAIQKTAEAAVDLIGDKRTKQNNNSKTDKNGFEIPNIYIYIYIYIYIHILKKTTNY